MKKRIITDLNVLQEHLKSYESKSRNDFKWLEDMADYFDYGFSYNTDYIDNVEMNSNLFKGIGIPQEHIHKWMKRSAIGGKIKSSYASIPHHDIIGNIAKSMVGYQRKRPFKPIVIDTGPNEGNERREESLSMIQKLISTRILPKYEEQATMNVFQKYGIQNPMELSPEDQEQVMHEIGIEMDELTPERIDDYMRRDYISPTSKQLSELLELLTNEYDIKFMTDENFKMALCSGIEVYYNGIRGGQLVLEPVNPKGLIYGDYDSSWWIQDSMWVKYTDTLPVVEILKRYGDELDSGDISTIKKATTSMSSVEELENAKLVGIMGIEGEIEDIDLRTLEGQWQYHSVKNKYGVNVSADVLEVKHIVFQSVDEAKFVTRMVDGRMRGFYTGRDYEINRLKGDIEVKSVKVPQVFEVTKIETGSKPIYVNKGQVPYTYRSIENPFKVTLPYTGAKYNKMMGNGELVSHIDLGKQGQYKYNVTYAKMEEEEASDIGKVMTLILSLKPSKYDTKTWINMLKEDKLLVLGEENSSSGEINPNILNAIKHIDLSTMDKIQSMLTKLDAIQKHTARAMGYNEAMLGQASPYESITNQENSINLSANQTEDVYVLHDKIVEKTLTHFLQTALIYYKDRPLKRSWVMSDMSVGSLELNPDLIHASEVGVFLSMNIMDMQEAEQMKRDAHALIQNEQVDFEDYVRIRMAKSTTELLNVSRESTRKKNKIAAEQRQMMKEDQQEEREYQMQVKMFEAEKEDQARAENNAAKIQMASLSAEQFSRAYDINQDNINDANERLEMELAYKREKDIEDRRIKLLELAIEEEKIKQQAKIKRKGN